MFILILARACSFLFEFIKQLAHSELSQNSIDIVVQLNIHLHSINDIEIASAFLIVTIFVRNRAFSCEDLSHVIILHVGQSLAIVFIASAKKVMQVIDDGEDAAVHHH